MIATDGLMFEVGIIMLVAFIGAAVASKAKQSVILGYILAGMLIGPYISVELFGYTYDGLVKDTEFIQLLSSLGLTLLLHQLQPRLHLHLHRLLLRQLLLLRLHHRPLQLLLQRQVPVRKLSQVRLRL